MSKICILDYGLGNIKSLFNSIRHLGYQPNLFSENKKDLYDLIIIPGVGSFSLASNLIINDSKIMNFLKLHKSNSKILGICLGMQILFEKGYEYGESMGLSYLEGDVKKLSKKKIILPFVGFQNINIANNYKNFSEFNNQKFYFVHSYRACPKNESNIIATTIKQDIEYTCFVNSENIFGTQFHPEKSGEAGLELLNKIIKI